MKLLFFLSLLAFSCNHDQQKVIPIENHSKIPDSVYLPVYDSLGNVTFYGGAGIVDTTYYDTTMYNPHVK